MQWLAREVEVFGVDLRLGVWAEAADVLGEDPDVVVVEHGTVPAAELFHALEAHSGNRGRTDSRTRWRAGHRSRSAPRARFRSSGWATRLASRNIHAALYDSLRVCKDL